MRNTIRIAVLIFLYIGLGRVGQAVPNPEAEEEEARRNVDVEIMFVVTTVTYSQLDDQLWVDASVFVKDEPVGRSDGVAIGDIVNVRYGVTPAQQDTVAARDFEAKRPGRALRLPIPVLRDGDYGTGWLQWNDDRTLSPAAGQYSFELIERRHPLLVTSGQIVKLNAGDTLIVESADAYLRLVSFDESKAVLDVIQEGRHRTVVLSHEQRQAALSDDLVIALNDLSGASISVSIIPTPAWSASREESSATLPDDWQDALLFPITDYVTEMSRQGDGQVVASSGSNQLVYFVSASEPTQGSEQAASTNGLLGIYSTDQNAWEGQPWLVDTSFIGRHGGCWTAVHKHLFYGDINTDGRIDIAMLGEVLRCSTYYDDSADIDRYRRMHRIGSLQWFTQNEEGRWFVDSAMENHCPRGDFGLISSQGSEENSIGKALDHNPTIDETTGALPWCAERAIEQGFYRPTPVLSGDLLEYDYMNFAWGFVRSGVVVDKVGQVFTMTAEAPDGDLHDRMQVVGPFDGTMPSGQTTEMLSTIRNMDAVVVPKPEVIKCCDMGTGSYTAWRFGLSSDTFEKVPLAKEGAHEWEHPDAAASDVVAFLKRATQVARERQ